MSIIPLSDPGLQTITWQQHLKQAVRTIEELSRHLDLPLDNVASDFPLLVPRPYLSRIARGEPDDPLLRQILPTLEETIQRPGYTQDPLEESAARQGQKGLINKYQGRSLVITSGACAINCRYCFRRHFPYDSEQPDSEDWKALIQTFREDPGTREVILSGGDPLMQNDRRLADLVAQIDEIPHVESIRIHTRLPVVIPQRVCEEMLDWLRACRKPVVIVVHINHPAEIDHTVDRAMQTLRSVGVTLLNQSVLLKGVNDSSETLMRLSKRLFSAGVLPYYLHLLDPVSGAGHFDVDAETGRQLIEEIATALPGYLVPKLVREVPGAAAKQPYPPPW